MTKGWLLVAQLLATALWADGFAHHDELAARRYRELSPETVASDLDKSRNKRWHGAGFWLRLASVMLVSGAVALAAGAGWPRLLLSMAVSGFEMALLFDVFFNLRFKMPWYYAGTTAYTDRWLNALKVTRRPEDAGKWAAGFELLGTVASAVAWLMIP
jgi:hypothetical protein